MEFKLTNSVTRSTLVLETIGQRLSLTKIDEVGIVSGRCNSSIISGTALQTIILRSSLDVGGVQSESCVSTVLTVVLTVLTVLTIVVVLSILAIVVVVLSILSVLAIVVIVVVLAVLSVLTVLSIVLTVLTLATSKPSESTKAATKLNKESQLNIQD